ncbi:hypothetical protein JCM10908_003767 [Rhodotorula pacifica]|uniref:uncharacterized protein n=1 Tax=Rhodotorula pacifica TaxID=1495444 RepID=UPI00316F657E
MPDGWSGDASTMTASYQSLPVPPPSSRSASRANPTPTSASAFSITGLKRLFGGAAAASSSSSRTASRNERSRRNRDSIPEEEEHNYRRPSVAKQHLASVVASLTGNSPASDVAESGYDYDERYSTRNRSPSRTRTSTGATAGNDFGTSAGGGSGSGGAATAFKSPRTGSDARTHSSSRSRSRSRPPSSSAEQHQHRNVLPDGQRFVRPMRLSGASPSVRVSLQNAETNAILSSSVGASGSHYGGVGGGGGGGRPSSEFRFPLLGGQAEGSPTLSEELPAPDDGRPRRLSFNAIPGLSSLTGRGSRAVDDDARSVWSMGGTGVRSSPSAYELMRRIRNEGLSTRYWIKDESAKDCFQCGSAFTTFRRRHHCRICGQIFCISCASTILPHFGNLERVRVCDGCRPAAERHESLRLSRTPTWEDDRASVSRYRSPTTSHEPSTTPASSRYYRPSSIRPRHSRLSTSNSLPDIHDERSPAGGVPLSPHTRSPIDEEARSIGRLHRLSTEATPAGSDSGAPARTDSAAKGRAADGDGGSDYAADEGAQSPALSTATAPFRRSLGDEEHTASSSGSPSEAVGTSEEPSPVDSPVLHGLGLELNEALHDDMDEKLSPLAAEVEVLPRGVSFLPAQGLHGGQRGPLGLGRSDSRLSGHLIDSLPETPFDMSVVDPDVYHFDAFRAAEAMEVPLSQASTAHIQRTIRQTLIREKVPSVDAWAPVLETLLYDVADRLAMLDEVEVGNFAIHDHVRVKRIPGGRPRDSEFVSGVVITKNVMHKSMPRHLSNPRIMLLSFPLEYQRNDGQYLSLDKVVTQEHEYLRNLILRIQDSFPHIILVERNVSQVALDYLLERGIVVARHVKASALASLSHSFGAELISSMNSLLDPRLGRCRSFRVQTFVHPKIPGGRKTFLRFEGDSHSSCTIVLRGGSMDDLAKVKRIIHTLVLVVYNAKLEGYLLHDERVEAHVPPMHDFKSAPPAPSLAASSVSSENSEAETSASDISQDSELSQSFQPYEEVELTGSALVHYPPPYSLQRVAEDARRVKALRVQRDAEEAQRILQEERDAEPETASSLASISDSLSVEPVSLATSPAMPEAAGEKPLSSTAPSVVDLQLDRPEDLARQALVDEAESAQAQHLADWKAYSLTSPETFDLRDHQRLFVLESLVLYRPDGEPSRLCRPPEVRSIDFYRDTDTTIGQYLRKADTALKSDEPCPSPTCSEPLHRHIRVFVHDQVILRVAWHSWSNDMLQGAIGLSSTCRREGCHCASRLVRASPETSRLSLGKFFDLSFHPSGAFECLDESCGHDGQADHVRFWHFGDVRVSISMDYIDLRDIVAPPRQVKVRPDRQVELRNAECAQVQRRAQAFFDSVQARLAAFKLDCVAPERMEECQDALNGFSERCEAERRAIDSLLRSTYEQAQHSNGTEMIDVRRALQERSHAFDADWASFVKRIVPADFSDFRRASAQLSRIFPEAPASVSPSSRIASGALPPPIEVDEPTDGAEPPPPSPHSTTATEGLEEAQSYTSMAELPSPGPSAGSELLPVTAERTLDAVLNDEGDLDPSELQIIGTSKRTIDPPPLSRSSTVRARRSSTGSEAESDSTVCADGETTARLASPESPFIRRQVSPVDETSAAESERDMPVRRRRTGPQVAALVSAFEAVHPRPAAFKSSERPTVRRAVTERPSEGPRYRPRPSHAVSDTDSSYARMVGVLHLAPDPLAAAAARPTRIPHRKPAQKLALARVFEPDKGMHSALPSRTPSRGSKRTSPVSSRSSSRAGSRSRSISPEATRPSGSLLYPGNVRRQRPTLPRTSSSNSTIKSKLPKSNAGDSESSDARATGQSRISRGFSTQRGPTERGFLNRSGIVGHASRHAATQKTRPVGASQSTGQVIDSIRVAINDQDEYESGGADDELDEDYDAPDLDDEGDGTTCFSPMTSKAAEKPVRVPPRPPHTASSSMSDALILSHEPSPVDAPANLEIARSDASGGWTAMPPPSPAFVDSSTFPRMSEGESSGTERKSIFNTFTSLWNYRNGEFAPLAYPTLPTEHLYLDNPILLRDDEPTSLIAHALSSRKYYQAFESAGLPRIRAGLQSGGIGRQSATDVAGSEETAEIAENILRGSSQRSFKLGDVELGDISARCTVFWVEQFEALRQQCGCGTQFIESLARCLKWDAAGGKSKVDFMKTLDDRFIVKQLSRPEMEVFARFAPAYFQYMADALFHSKPTVLAKVFGIYRISLGKHYRNVDFLVMENLFYGRELKQIFDLKGSTRNRRAEENNPVLLDENLIELSLKSPIYVREESKQLVKEAIFNDSQFLADLNVMDYSLVIGVDATKPELVLGIVDYIRTYTWDKRLESWVKETAFLGGTYKSGGPTVITPKQYKARFREAIDGYLLLSPTPWLNWEKLRTAPKDATTASAASANDAASIVEPPTSAAASLLEHFHPAPAPPPSDSASIFEAALGPF